MNQIWPLFLKIIAITHRRMAQSACGCPLRDRSGLHRVPLPTELSVDSRVDRNLGRQVVGGWVGGGQLPEPLLPMLGRNFSVPTSGFIHRSLSLQYSFSSLFSSHLGMCLEGTVCFLGKRMSRYSCFHVPRTKTSAWARGRQWADTHWWKEGVKQCESAGITKKTFSQFGLLLAKFPRLGHLNNRTLFLTSGTWQAQDQGADRSDVWWEPPLSGLQLYAFSLCLHNERGRTERKCLKGR